MDQPYHKIVTVDWVDTTLSNLIGRHVPDADSALTLGRAVADAVKKQSPSFDRTRFLDQVQISHDRHHPPPEAASPVPTTLGQPVTDN